MTLLMHVLYSTGSPMAWRSVYNVSRATGADVTLSVGPAK
jgi:hypothetical protein